MAVVEPEPGGRDEDGPIGSVFCGDEEGEGEGEERGEGRKEAHGGDERGNKPV